MAAVAGSASLIPPNLHGQLFDLSQSLNPATSRKWTDRELVGWLEANHGIECSRDTVSHVLGPLRREAREALLERVRASVAEKIPEQFAQLDELMERAHKDGLNSKASRARMRGIETFRKCLDTKVRHVAGDDAKVTLSGSPNTLAEFLSVAFGEGEGEGESPADTVAG